MSSVLTTQLTIIKRIRVRALYLAVGIAIGYTACLYLAGGLVSAS